MFKPLILILMIVFAVFACSEPGSPPRGGTPVCNHQFDEWIEITPANCISPAEEEAICSLCGYISTRDFGDPLGHQWNYDYEESWEITILRTPIADGEEKRTCLHEGCSEPIETRIIPAGCSHEWMLVPLSGTAPTCIEHGYGQLACTVLNCGAHYPPTGVGVLHALGHSFGSWYNTTPATCLADGEEIRDCTRLGCNHFETSTVEKHGHSFSEWTETRAVTCLVQNEEQRSCIYSCGLEGQTETRSSVNALGHSFGSWMQTRAATCLVQNEEQRTCTRSCGLIGHTETRSTINAFGHSFGLWIETRAATCLLQNEEQRTCIHSCGLPGYTETRSTISALVEHSFGSWAETRTATCTVQNEEQRSCIHSCGLEGHTQTRFTVDALGHSFGSWTETRAATCTVQNEEQRTCTRSCGLLGHTETRSTISALGHSFGLWIETREATCTIQNQETRTCTRSCGLLGHTETRSTINALEHQGLTPPFSATCTAAGNSQASGTCTRAGCVVTGMVINALGHQGLTPAFAATCTTAGNSQASGTCTRAGCGQVVTGTIINALGHDTVWGAITTYPTTTVNGTQVGICSRCAQDPRSRAIQWNVTTLASEPGFGGAVDSSGNVYVADYFNHRIRKITPAGNVTTLAGSGTAGFADGLGASAQFNAPSGIAVDSAGNVYVADDLNHRIRKITPAGNVTTLAGSGTQGSADGLGASASFTQPSGIAVDSAGNVYVAEYRNDRIRKITPAGNVTTLAGSTPGFADGLGASAQFFGPMDVAVDSAGNVYVADTRNHRIRKITPAGNVTTLAGSGTAGFADGLGASAQFSTPNSVAVDSAGNVYVADNQNNRIRRITPAGNVTTIAGSGTAGFANGLGASARFNRLNGVAVDSTGNVYVADFNNSRIGKIEIVPVP